MTIWKNNRPEDLFNKHLVFVVIQCFLDGNNYFLVRETPLSIASYFKRKIVEILIHSVFLANFLLPCYLLLTVCIEQLHTVILRYCSLPTDFTWLAVPSTSLPSTFQNVPVKLQQPTDIHIWLKALRPTTHQEDAFLTVCSALIEKTGTSLRCLDLAMHEHIFCNSI